MTLNGARLKQLRTRQRISKVKLAALVGVERQAVYEWENGKSQPRADTLASLAKHLRTNSSYLLNEIDYPLAFGLEVEKALVLLDNGDIDGAMNEAANILRKKWRKRRKIPRDDP